MYLVKWAFVITYCVLIAGLANMRACQDETVLHVGAFNHVQTLPE